jgi:small-conductance mechanosensitive channel
MFTFLGFEITLPEFLIFLQEPLVSFAVNLAAWILVALLVNLVVMRFLLFITRQLPGDLEDIILGILRRPVFLLILLYGVNKSLQLLPLVDDATFWIRRVSLTLLVIVLAHVIGHLIKDVLVYYGGRWAARTESQVDDVLVPVFSLFGPVLVTLVAALIILPLWGVDVSSVLVGAGILGLVLGLALQETLGNIFSGLSLIMEAPFRLGDLILLPNGRICEVQKLGLRSTTLFSLDEQATIFMPNKTLVAESLINLTKPTSEQKYHLEFHTDIKHDLVKIEEILLSIANGHPAVLSSNIQQKLNFVEKQVAYLRTQAKSEGQVKIERQSLAKEADSNDRSLSRLALEGNLNEQVEKTKESIRKLIRGIQEREVRGLTEFERQELICNYISPCEAEIERTAELAREWVETKDGWLNHTDYWHLRKIWQARNEQLGFHWQVLKKNIQSPNDRLATRLDDMASAMIDWIDTEYKIVPGYWKDPMVEIREVEQGSATILLHYYVDNIRLENDGRPRRVRTELNRIVRDRFIQEGIWP